MLRTIFSEKCSQAGMKDKYIDAFCGRIPFEVVTKENKPELSEIGDTIPIDDQFANKTTTAQFVDPSKNPQYYVDRYQ